MVHDQRKEMRGEVTLECEKKERVVGENIGLTLANVMANGFRGTRDRIVGHEGEDVGKNSFSNGRLAQVHNKYCCVNRHVTLFVIKLKYKAKNIDHNIWSVSGYPCCLTFEITIFQSKPPS